MKLYDWKEPLYLESDTFGIGLGVGLLQVREEMNCWNDTAVDNFILRNTASVSKSQLSAKML